MKTCETCKYLYTQPELVYTEFPCKGFWGKLGVTDYEVVEGKDLDYFCMALPKKVNTYIDRPACSLYEDFSEIMQDILQGED